MHIKKNVSVGLITIMAFFITNCGKDGFEAPDSTTSLTQAQANALGEFLGIDGVNDVFDDSFFASGGNSGSFGYDDGEVFCDTGEIPTGGSGSANIDTDNASANLTANSQTIQQCLIDGAQGSDIEITSGDIEWKGNYSETATTYKLNATIRGSINISGADVTTGTCGFSLDYEDDDGDETVTGNICDVDVSIDL